MRVLRVDLGDERVLDLHPSVSVVTGLSDDHRTLLRCSFRAIGTGLAPDVPALVEARGLLLDATQDDLDLLGVPATPAGSVATAAEVPGAVPAEDAERLRTADRDLVRLASDRWRACEALTTAEAIAARPTQADLRARAVELRARIGRHEARDAEPVRVALDDVRDRHRAGVHGDAEPLVEALAGVGLDVRDLGLPVAESVRMAEDWLDERRQEASWVLGAEVELQGIERAPATGDDRQLGVDVSPGELDELRRRTRQTAEALADAVDRADELGRALADRHRPDPAPDELERHLSARLAGHRPDRLAGTVPLLLDGVLGRVDGADVGALLDRLTELAGGVQLVIVDDHPAVREWAVQAGARRAAVVTPSPSSPLPCARNRPQE